VALLAEGAAFGAQDGFEPFDLQPGAGPVNQGFQLFGLN
jgi:hypothetical protein